MLLFFSPQSPVQSDKDGNNMQKMPQREEKDWTMMSLESRMLRHDFYPMLCLFN